MLSVVCPSHHLFYSALHRRRLWLEHLYRTFQTNSQQPAQPKLALQNKYRHLLDRMPMTSGLGIHSLVPLQNVLDDTPVDSFLTTLGEDFTSYEIEFFKLMDQTSSYPDLEDISKAWGQELAQECLLHLPFLNKIKTRKSILGLLEVLQTYLMGGEFSWKPFLLRRYTDTQLEYELRNCPHEHGSSKACQLESKVYEGFVRTLLPQSEYQRLRNESYCLDRVHLA